MYAYLTKKANGDKEVVAPWKDKPPPKLKPSTKAKTALRKRTRKNADDGTDGKTAKQPSLNVLIKQLTRMKSNSTDLRRLASLLSENPPQKTLLNRFT